MYNLSKSTEKIFRKLALLEILEVDQYIWSILRHVAGTRFDEVIIDNKANWRPSLFHEATEEGLWGMEVVIRCCRGGK